MKKPKHITARSITLTDGKGKTRIHMDAGDGDGYSAVCIFGDEGRSIQISAQPNGTMIVAIHGKKSMATLFISENDDASLDLRDRKGLIGATVGAFLSPGEHNVTVCRDGQDFWTTRGQKGKRTKKKK